MSNQEQLEILNLKSLNYGLSSKKVNNKNAHYLGVWFFSKKSIYLYPFNIDFFSTVQKDAPTRICSELPPFPKIRGKYDTTGCWNQHV